MTTAPFLPVSINALDALTYLLQGGHGVYRWRNIHITLWIDDVYVRDVWGVNVMKDFSAQLELVNVYQWGGLSVGATVVDEKICIMALGDSMSALLETLGVRGTNIKHLQIRLYRSRNPVKNGVTVHDFQRRGHTWIGLYLGNHGSLREFLQTFVHELGHALCGAHHQHGPIWLTNTASTIRLLRDIFPGLWDGVGVSEAGIP